MTRGGETRTAISALLGVAGVSVGCALAPRAPALVFTLTAALVWLLATLTPGEKEAMESGARPPRGIVLALALFAALVAKDILPVGMPLGAEERRAAVGGTALDWPATARNPALGAAAGHWSALLLAGACTLALARATAGSARRGAFVLSAAAWLLAGFGALAARAGAGYAENPVWISASKNGAATLVALGALLHGGLAVRAWGRSRMALAGLHGAAAAALLAPLGTLSSWTGLLALAAGAGALALTLSRRAPGRPGTWLLAGAIGTGLAIAVAAAQPALVRRVADFTADYRFGIWRDAAALLAEQPFLGIGAGAFETTYPLVGKLHLVFDARLSHPDSSWALLTVEWGLLPLAAALWLAWRLRLALRLAGPRGELEPAAIARAGLAAWLAAGLTDIAWHRPENLAVATVLLGVAAGSAVAGVSRRQAAITGAAAVAAGAALATWSTGPGARELRWGLLDPARLWNEALTGGAAAAAEPARLARLRAAVRLQHRAVSYPFAVAKLLHAVSPEAAFEFWRTAVRRADDLGFDYLAQAAAAFPGTPADYWLRLARETGPDDFLFIPSLAGAEAERELAAWTERAPAATLRPAVARQFLRVASRLGRADLVERVAARTQVTDDAFLEEAARMLSAAGRSAAAWRALERRLPRDETTATGRPPPTGSLTVLLAGERFADLRERVLADASAGTVEALSRICAHPRAPVWFHFRLARVRAAAGDPHGAVEAGLRGLAIQSAPR